MLGDLVGSAAASSDALATRYLRYATDVASASPLSARAADALSRSTNALRVLAGLPARRRHPALVLAALHDLTLAGRAPELATAYAQGDADAAAAAAVRTLVGQAQTVADAVARRRLPTAPTGHAAVLGPAVAEAARRVGAPAIGLVSVACAAGFDLTLDRVRVRYDNGQRLGDPASPVQVRAAVVGDRPVPQGAIPEVVARIGLDAEPLDLTDPADARWLHACLGPDEPDRHAHLDAEITLLASTPPLLLRGDVVDRLPEALAAVPADALPVVTTTWALSGVTVPRRRRFLDRLREAASDRPAAWVSVEGVGVAPTVPTLGDRPASGHSIIGLGLYEGSTAHTEALGRCWSRGRLLSWLA